MMRMYTTSSKQHGGYSFIEVLVSITILLIAIVGPLTIASKGLQNAYFAREQNIAFFLAQEALEGVRDLQAISALGSMRADGSGGGNATWGWTSSGIVPAQCYSSTGCGIVMNPGNFWSGVRSCTSLAGDCRIYKYPPSSWRYAYRHYSGAAGVETPYKRKLYFERIDDDGSQAMRVRAVVTWRASTYGAERSVELETYIYDFYKYELDI